MTGPDRRIKIQKRKRLGTLDIPDAPDTVYTWSPALPGWQELLRGNVSKEVPIEGRVEHRTAPATDSGARHALGAK